MKAAVIKGPKNLVVEDVSKPTCGENEILLRVTKACFCKETDWQIYTRTSPFQDGRNDDWFPAYPHIQGHECAGVIEQVGSKVNGFETGERIGYYYQMTGAFAQYVAINPDHMAILRIQDNWSDDEATLVEPLVGTMRGIWSSGLRPGDKVAVFGQGAMGLLLAQEARAFGAAAIAVTDISDFRLSLAGKIGAADVLVNVGRTDCDGAAKEILTKIGQVDIVIDAIGDDMTKQGYAMDLGVEILRGEGSYFIYGFPNVRRGLNLTRFAGKCANMFMRQCPLDRARRLALIGRKLVDEGRIQLKPLITNRINLSEIAEGIKLCDPANDKDIKIMIEVDK